MSALSAPRVGVIGTGLMGKPMAANLLKAGFPVVVFNRTASRADDLVAAGATRATSPRELAEQSDVTITMLVDWPATRAAVFGPGGVLEGIRRDSLFIDMGTTSPKNARELACTMAGKGVAALDAPVSGGEKGAIEGTLTIMAGGSDAAFARAVPVFAAMGKSWTHIGDAGAGQIAKACNQIIVAGTIALVAESLALARAYHVDPVLVRQALLGGFAGSRLLEIHGQRMLDRNFKPGGAIKSHMKDRENVLEACATTGLDLPVAKVVFEKVKEVVDRGQGDLDDSVYFTLFDAASLSS